MKLVLGQRRCHYRMSVARPSPCRCSPCWVRVAESPSNLFRYRPPEMVISCLGGPKDKIYPQRVPMSYTGESGPGVAEWYHRTTSSIFYLVANQIKDGRVVVSSLILSLSLRACCRRGGATARGIPDALSMCTMFSLALPTNFCRELEEHGT